MVVWAGVKDIIIHDSSTHYLSIFDSGVEFSGLKTLTEIPLPDTVNTASPQVAIMSFKQILHHYLFNGYITEQSFYVDGTGWDPHLTTITNAVTVSAGASRSVSVGRINYTMFTRWNYTLSRLESVGKDLADDDWVRIGEGDDAELCQVSSVSANSFAVDLMKDHAPGTKIWRAARSVIADLKYLYQQNKVISFERDQETITGTILKVTTYPVIADELVATKYKIKGTFIWGKDL